MKYLLDTNTCIRYLNGRAPNILTKIQLLQPDDIAVCSVVKAELFYGSQRSQNPSRTLARQLEFLQPYVSLPFNDVAAKQYGIIRAYLATEGKPIGPNDLMIASIALVNNLILVTHNTKEFGRVPRLKLEDWEISE